MPAIELNMIRQCIIFALFFCCRAVTGYSYYNSLSVCADSSIDVTGVSILCDTPGVWYYGSNGYRQSSTCQSGDKATLIVTFDIIEDLSANVDSIFLTLLVNGGEEEIVVYNNALLCSIGTLSRTSKVDCPYQGSFTIKTKFYFGSDDNGGDSTGDDRYLGDDDDRFKNDDGSDATNVGFTPRVTVGFASNKNSGAFDLGGANTDLCAGQSTNIDSVIDEKKSSGLSEPIVRFLLSFGILIGVIFVLGGIAFYIWKNGSCDRAFFQEEVDFEASRMDDSARKIALMGQTTGILAL